MALPDAYAGAVAIDLVLASEAEVQLQSGFHLKVDGSIFLDIGMFAQNISGTDFPDSQFEFLPLTVSHGNEKVTGVLRVELKAGLEIQKHTMDVFDKGFNIGTGAQMNIFANVAQFEVHISKESESGDIDCQLGFEINVSAAAGTALALGKHIWGPMPKMLFSMRDLYIPEIAAPTFKREGGTEDDPFWVEFAICYKCFCNKLTIYIAALLWP
ncbi:hypothetical protein FAVG1_10533 [Fusarium avenaceum]|nr:hypothetical protein FAVG1_10533 [Fusarium avenaceum]